MIVQPKHTKSEHFVKTKNEIVKIICWRLQFEICMGGWIFESLFQEDTLSVSKWTRAAKLCFFSGGLMALKLR